MNEKERNIVETAIGVISRYGVRRTTMGDIASAAGISRQTLYSNYANKEEVLAAAICYSTDRTMEALEADWSAESSIADKLDAYFQHCVIAYYDMLSQMPDAEDLVTGYNTVGKAEQDKAMQRKGEVLASLLAPYKDRLAKAGMTPEDLADMVLNASSNFKYVAKDRPHLLKLIGSLRQAALSLIGKV
ncbi:TetR/AcrR family transcriptional regulator [Hoeflea sp.]|uniref:TetR/AcrR family transcriptional regulator n=1 Tax=Hoeflea sp. TaxID=1940281 RepID=UPI003B01FAA2